jgi:hypothetical protein
VERGERRNRTGGVLIGGSQVPQADFGTTAQIPGPRLSRPPGVPGAEVYTRSEVIHYGR